MSFLELMRTRRSIRVFQEKAVEDEKIDVFKEVALRAPSGRSKEPWHFVFVHDARIIKKLAACKAHGSELLDGAPLAIVVVADESVTDVWTEDCSIAAISLQYAAHEMGLGSCWVQVRLRETAAGESSEGFVKKTLGIADDTARVLCVIAIGYPGEVKKPRSASTLDHEKIALM
jgi:nitroreductase